MLLENCVQQAKNEILMPIWHFSATLRHFSLFLLEMHWIFYETRQISFSNRNFVMENDSWLSFNKSRSTRDCLSSSMLDEIRTLRWIVQKDILVEIPFVLRFCEIFNALVELECDVIYASDKKSNNVFDHDMN